MINYMTNGNNIYIYENVESENMIGVDTPPVDHNSETECIVWNGFNWVIKPISFKTDLELQYLKSVASGKLQVNYQNRLLLGYTDTLTNITLSGDEESFNELQKLSHRVNNKKSAGNIEGHTQSFFDKSGTPQSLPGQACIELLDRYGDWWEQMYMLNKMKYASIQSAVTSEALEEIDLDFPTQEVEE